MPTTYSTELKIKTVHRYEKGESIKSLSEELHIAQSTLYQWRKEYCSSKTPNRTYTPKEFDAVSRRLQKLERQLEIIRLTGYLSNRFAMATSKSRPSHLTGKLRFGFCMMFRN